MTPGEFIQNGPQSPEDLVGKARSVARVFCARAKSGDVTPIRLLCYGPPGIGKSATCKIIARALVNHPVAILCVSAKQITVEHVRDWMTELRYVNDRWRVYLIEEVDVVNPDVETLLLHFLDLLTNKTAVLATSNERMSGIEDRFQSRMQAVRFDKPTVRDVEKFLIDRWPELGPVAREIAEANNGDVRASLNDAQMHVDVERLNNTGGNV